jgi:Uma2 family endonuclease
MIELLTESPIGLLSAIGPYRVADYLALPDEPRCELLRGRLYLSPSPTTAHQAAVAQLWTILNRLALQTGGMAFVAPLDVTLAEHSVVQPDVIFISHERREIALERIEGAPDLVVEVLSPSTVGRDRGEKQQLYASAGVDEYWLVDPAAEQIEFLVREGGRFALDLPVDGAYRSSVIPGLQIDVISFWSAVSAMSP